jgi:hypothetical protein
VRCERETATKKFNLRKQDYDDESDENDYIWLAVVIFHR